MIDGLDINFGNAIIHIFRSLDRLTLRLGGIAKVKYLTTVVTT